MRFIEYIKKKNKNIILKNLCSKCIFYQKKIPLVESNFSIIDLEKILNKSSKEKYNNVIKKLNFKNIKKIINFKLENIPIGKFAIYEILLSFKKRKLDLNKEEKKIFIQNFKKCLIVYYATKDLINSYPFSDIVINNNSYSLNRTLMVLCKKYKKNTYNFEHGEHFGKRLSLLELSRLSSTTNHNYFLKEKIWPKYKNRNILTQENIDLVFEHYKKVFDKKLNMTFSKKPKKNFDIRNNLKILKSQKIILLVSSSYDEQFAARVIGNRYPKKKIFKSNIEWFEFMINYAKKNSRFFFIFRIHPREIPSSRNPLNSQSIKNFYKIFNQKLPPNIFINWPEQNISLYNILPYTDLVLTEGSNVTLEALLFGLPVMTCSKDYSVVPNDLVINSKSKVEYAINIKKNINKSIKIECIIKSLNWMVLKFIKSKISNLNSFYINENYSNRFFNKFFKIYFLKFNLYKIKLIREKDLKLKEIIEKNKFSPSEIITENKYIENNELKKLINSKILNLLKKIYFNFSNTSKLGKYFNKKICKNTY